MIYKEEFKIGLKDVGKENQVNNKAILEYLEDIAAYHSDSVGYGVNTSDTNSPAGTVHKIFPAHVPDGQSSALES